MTTTNTLSPAQEALLFYQRYRQQNPLPGHWIENIYEEPATGDMDYALRIVLEGQFHTVYVDLHEANKQRDKTCNPWIKLYVSRTDRSDEEFEDDIGLIQELMGKDTDPRLMGYGTIVPDPQHPARFEYWHREDPLTMRIHDLCDKRRPKDYCFARCYTMVYPAQSYIERIITVPRSRTVDGAVEFNTVIIDKTDTGSVALVTDDTTYDATVLQRQRVEDITIPCPPCDAIN